MAVWLFSTWGHADRCQRCWHRPPRYFHQQPPPGGTETGTGTTSQRRYVQQYPPRTQDTNRSCDLSKHQNTIEMTLNSLGCFLLLGLAKSLFIFYYRIVYLSTHFICFSHFSTLTFPLNLPSCFFFVFFNLNASKSVHVSLYMVRKTEP